MSEEYSYKDYVSEESFMEKYSSYQKRYVENIRESDRVIIDLIRQSIEEKKEPLGNLRLLDIGCSTGNLLKHIRSYFPSLGLTGGDFASKVIRENRQNPDLNGIQFEEMDVTSLGKREEYDFITVNAVLYLFDHPTFEKAILSLSMALKKKGTLIVFDFFHPFRQELSIKEESCSHPDGLLLHLRSYARTLSVLEKYQFQKIAFNPFKIPVDLEKGLTYSDNKDGFEDLNSYTVKSENGERLIFRGCLYQPWCHLIAQKSNC